jgi:hypothetical protein
MRPAKKGRIGTIMVTPPKLPANDNLPPLMRTVLYVVRPARLWRGRCVVASLDARMQVLRLLAEFPEVRVNGAKGVLYDAVEAAELDEPGAMAVLIELKLSANAQFQDRPGACKLIETAVSRGDQTMARRLADCRAN